MEKIADKGNRRQQFNAKFADIVTNLLGQRFIYKMRYYKHRHRFPNFDNPRDLSERLLAAMLSDDFLKYAQYADKIKVRDYVSQKGCSDILLEQYGTWEDANQIDFDKLPDKYILKANNGCGGHIICTDKTTLDIPSTIQQMNESLKGAERLRKTEPHYCAIKPMLLAEQLMGNGSTLPVDYKFYCIKGEVCFIFVASERETGVKFAALDTDWNQLPYIYGDYLPKQVPKRPEHLSEMVEVAKKLSSDFDFVRVDLYDFQGKVYFGELTFSPLGGILSYFTTETLEFLGNKFDE